MTIPTTMTTKKTTTTTKNKNKTNVLRYDSRDTTIRLQNERTTVRLERYDYRYPSTQTSLIDLVKNTKNGNTAVHDTNRFLLETFIICRTNDSQHVYYYYLFLTSRSLVVGVAVADCAIRYKSFMIPRNRLRLFRNNTVLLAVSEFKANNDEEVGGRCNLFRRMDFRNASFLL